MLQAGAKKMKTSNFDLFVLGMLKHAHLETLYDFRRAGVPGGMSLPSLRKLCGQDLVAAAPEKGSTRLKYALTARGEDIPNWALGQQLSRIPRSSEAVQRTFWLTHFEGQRREADAYLTSAAFQREREARKQERAAEAFRSNIANPLGGWLWLRAVCESHRLESEAKAFRQVADAFSKEDHPA